ncbi:type I DNA topoisomerase [Patescibacteria group bacterium]|nr:type I DNA topoisomerase [Patescibacteria group bacterium]MBU1970606.1 type I DNA topoisomerase [Patescibacteria group bacterium]
MQLVIVESPTKAKTLGTILGKEYVVKASMGHVRDLPKSGLGVDVAHNFEPEYIVPDKVKKTLTDLRKQAKEAKQVILATDPDREGEAIAWHLKELLKLKEASYGRAVFHEITKSAVQNSFDHQGKLDINLVDAQQARRVLDRLVGYKLSPLLWKKVRYGLSAGRVQSVAVRIVVEREREREAFKPVEYWSVEGLFDHQNGSFTAQFSEQDGKKLDLTGQEQVDKLLTALQSGKYQVQKVTRTQKQKKPYPPLKTSTLQQSASNMFGFPAYKTMKAAQALFEKGLITYHRTDSLNLAQQFIDETRKYVGQAFSKAHLPDSPNVYKTSSKSAQEAHEAIRITKVDLVPGDKALLKFSADEQKIYYLIWRRSIECQMAPAIYDATSVEILSDTGYGFRASGSVIKFPGFLALAGLANKDSGEEGNGNGEVEETKNQLPQLAEGDPLKLTKLDPAQHFTQPPPRYTDASLIKALEEMGVGRPSTYAPTIQTIISRGYVSKEGRSFKPADVAYVVTDLLTKHFTNVVDYDFTARMEEELDEIAAGKLKWQPVIKEFYAPFEQVVKQKDRELKKQDITFLGLAEEKCPKCGKQLMFKLGKYGKFLSCSDYPTCEFAKPVEENITSLVDENGETTAAAPQDYGKCVVCGEGDYILRQGRFGKFLACSRYPDCKSTKPFLVKIGLKCPTCKEGDVVVKKAKNRTFYGCSRYPECKYSSWKKPTISDDQK